MINTLLRLVAALAIGTLLSAPVTAQSKKLEIEGASLGGKVRSGPGTSYKVADMLKKSSLVTILEDTGVMLDGYPWFKIVHIDNASGYSVSGYQWGKTLCSFSGGVSGLYNKCPKFWSDSVDVSSKAENEETKEQPIAPVHGNSDEDNQTADAVISQCLAAENAAQRDGSACVTRFAETCNEKTEAYSRGNSACSIQEHRVWDGILNAQYKKLMSVLDSNAKKNDLRDSQRTWVKFKTQFCPLSYKFTMGSMHRVTSANCLIRVTAQQAFELYRLVAVQSEPRTCAITHCP